MEKWTEQIHSYGSLLSGDWVNFWSPGYGTIETQGGACIVFGATWKPLC